jgi:hypothetical protein
MKLRRTAAMLLTLMFLLQSSIVPAAAQVIPAEEAPVGFTSTDSQANLYRTMLQTGGPKSDDNVALLERLRAGATTGIVYFMTNDQISLSDALVLESGAIPGWEVLEGDVAHLAMNLIRERLREVRAGQLYLNREGDAQFFEKQAGLTPYALGNSPLIALFTVPGGAREAE